MTALCCADYISILSILVTVLTVFIGLLWAFNMYKVFATDKEKEKFAKDIETLRADFNSFKNETTEKSKDSIELLNSAINMTDLTEKQVYEILPKDVPFEKEYYKYEIEVNFENGSRFIHLLQRNTTIGNVIYFDKSFGGQRWVDSIPKVIYDLEFMLGDDHVYINVV